MTTIIALAQLKGGVGKSTLTTQLAGYFSQFLRVGVIDADMPQGTSSHWLHLRGDNKIALRQIDSANQLSHSVEQLDGDCDVILIDLPPRSMKFLRETIAFCDVLLMPVSASSADIWALEQLIELIGEAKKINNRLSMRLVWNRLRHGRLTDELLEHTASRIGTKEFSSVITQRNAYVECLGRGLYAEEWTDNKAKSECRALLKAVAKQAKIKVPDSLRP